MKHPRRLPPAGAPSLSLWLAPLYNLSRQFDSTSEGDHLVLLGILLLAALLADLAALAARELLECRNLRLDHRLCRLLLLALLAWPLLLHRQDV